MTQHPRLAKASTQLAFAAATFVAAQACAACSSTAWAQASADKSMYSLFNPTPDNLLRTFSTDRPTKSTVPQTVDAGRFQYEVDFFNAYQQKTGGVTTNSLTLLNSLMKVGLTSSIDLEIGTSAFQELRTRDGATGISTRSAGISDTIARLKMNLWGNEGGKTAFALVPWVKFPTAASGLGNGVMEGGIIAPLSFSLPQDRTLLVNFEVDQLKNANDGGYHASTTNLINLSGPIASGWTLYGELWSQVNFDPARTITQASFDAGLAWAVNKSTQLDVGANIGLTRDTPALQVYMGFAQRY